MGGALVAADKRKAIVALDETIRDSRREVIEAEKAGNDMLKALTLAEGMNAIRSQLTPELMAGVMKLAGSKLGFRTDRDNEAEGYSEEQIKDALIEALIRGFRPVGNEFNVIAGNFYATREGMERLIREFEGLTDLKLSAGVPATYGQQGALVPYSATWNLHGRQDAIHCQATKDDKGNVVEDTRIPVRVNSRMTVDAILGKARSKMLKRIYERLTGSEISVEAAEDAIDSTAVEVEFKVDEPSEMLAELEKQFNGCEQISDVHFVRDLAFEDESLTDDQRGSIAAMAEAAERRIRSSRGQRANK